MTRTIRWRMWTNNLCTGRGNLLGGGKTIVAAHAVGVSARSLFRVDRPLDDAFGGYVSITDLTSALNLPRGALDSDTVVIISAMAAIRTGNAEGRRAYEDNGLLMSDFKGLMQEQQQLTRAANGENEVVRSLNRLAPA